VNVCILFGYIKKCQIEGINPTKKGLYKFKNLQKKEPSGKGSKEKFIK